MPKRIQMTRHKPWCKDHPDAVIVARPSKLTSTEQWRPVDGLRERYEVSSHGRVRSLPFTTTRKNGRPYTHPGRILKPAYKARHAYVILYVATKRPKKMWVHRLVLEAFGGSKPIAGLEVNHRNGDPTDNRIENLEWVTRQENIQHARDNRLHARGERSGSARLNDAKVAQIRSEHHLGASHRTIARRYGITKSTVWAVVTRKTWDHVKEEHHA